MTFLHETDDFGDLLAVLGEELSINPGLIEKDYWIMHALYGLQQLGLQFELKGGTSLSKGYGLIHRFSEDIDIQIHPPAGVPTGKNQTKPSQIEARREFFDNLANEIAIPGIRSIEREADYDDQRMRSAGIMLNYDPKHPVPTAAKTGVLLEAGFDQVTPNSPRDFSSWAYDRAIESGIDGLKDNRALGVPCYNPEYTLVEKLHAISRKFRQQQRSGDMPRNFMRHYYDVYCLLDNDAVREFIGTPEYKEHKAAKFTENDDPDLRKNEAFVLGDTETRGLYNRAYISTQELYYREMPSFDQILDRIGSAASDL